MIGKEHRNFGFGRSASIDGGSQYAPPTIGVVQIDETASRPGDVLRVKVVYSEGNPPANPQYQWYRDGVMIAGATSQEYTLVQDDDNSEIHCVVSISNIAGSHSATTDVFQREFLRQPAISEVLISSSSPEVGGVMQVQVTYDPGNPSATPTYQWYRGGVAIPAQVAASYTTTQADDSQQIQCEVTLSNSEGSVTQLSNSLMFDFAPPNPEALGAIYWWSADHDFVISGNSVTWTDQVSGVTLRNTPHSNGVQFGVPKKIVTEDHDYRPSMYSRESGALHGPVTPMAQSRLLSIIVIARGGNAEYTRMFAGCSSNLSHSDTGRFSVNARDMSIYGSGGYQNFTGGPAAANQETVMYEWAATGGRTLAEIVTFADNTQCAVGLGTGGSRLMNADFPYIVIGGRPNRTYAIVLSNSEIENVIIIDRMDDTKRQQMRDWWAWRKAQRVEPDIRTSVVLQYGQSNAVGQDTSAETLYSRNGNVCFANYLLSWYGEQINSPSDRTNLQGLKERNFESGMAHGLNALVDRLMVRDAVTDWSELDDRYFALNPAVSGRSIEQLAASPDWPRVVQDIVASKNHVQNGGFDWVWWTHGYSNAGDARGAYYPKLVSMFNNIRAAAIAAGYSDADPNYIIAQHCTSRTNANFPSVGLSQLQLARDNPKVDIFPLYPMNWKNGIHMSNIGQKIKGEYYAKVMYDIENGGYQHVQFSLVSWTNTEIVVRVSGGNGNYVFDTTNIPAANNMGFDVWASNNTTLQSIISSVSISGDLITITLSAPATAGSRLGYGWGRVGMATPSNAPYPLGNLHDTDPRTTVMAGVTYPLFNWCVIQEVDMPA